LYIITTLVYVLSPFDLIPEAVFGLLGLMDDFGVIILAVVAVGAHMFDILQNQNRVEMRAR